MGQRVNRILCNIASSRLRNTQDFYTKWFDFKIIFESEWFIQLKSADGGFEIGIIEENNELLPSSFRGRAKGLYLTLVIDDVDELYEGMKDSQVEIVQSPEDTFYGQRRYSFQLQICHFPLDSHFAFFILDFEEENKNSYQFFPNGKPNQF